MGENILYQDVPEGARLELARNTIASPIETPMFLQGAHPLVWPLAEHSSQQEREARTADPCGPGQRLGLGRERSTYQWAPDLDVPLRDTARPSTGSYDELPTLRPVLSSSLARNRSAARAP